MRERTLGMLLVLCAACGSDAVVVPPSTDADLAVTLQAPGTVAVGQTLTYVVTTANAGPADAAGVTVTLTLPAGITVDEAFGGAVSGPEVSWAVGALAAGSARRDSVRALVTAGGALTASARAASTSPDPNAANNDGSAANARAATTASVAADVATYVRGAPFAAASTLAVNLTVVARNLGPSPAADVALTFRAAPNTPITAAAGGGVIIDSVVTWPAAALAAGDSVAYQVTIAIPAIGTASGRALATASTADPAPGNNAGGSSSFTTLVGFTPVRTITGEAQGDQFGWLAVNAGDLNGDGINDVVLSAPTNDAGGSDAGRVYAYSGATGASLWTVTGVVVGGQLGFGVDVVGDVDGDNVPDIAAGAPGAGAGAVFVISGASGTVLKTISVGAGGDQLGYSVGPAGDVTGDGVPDILAGAPGRDVAGQADVGRVVYIDGATLTPVLEQIGVIPGATFGSGVRTVGDLDGDGVPEYAVGAPTAPGGGRVYVFTGATGDSLFPSIASGPNGASFGQYWINSPGDVNGDAVPDIYAADINATGNAGRAVIISGATGGVLRTLQGESPSDQFGIGRGIPDVNGDGVGDLFLAAWLRSEGATQAGKAYLYSGADGRLLRTFVSTVGGDTMGFDAIGIGDVTGDGTPDFVITAGQNNGTGKAYVVAGIALN